MAKQQSNTVEESPLIKKTAPLDAAVDDNISDKVLSGYQEEPASSFKLPRLIKRVRTAAKTLWRANVGAVILVEANATQLFKRLVEEGEAFQNSSQKEGDVNAGNAAASVSNIKLRTVDRIHKIEHKIDSGVNHTLHWLGMPSRHDFIEMSDKVNDLTESLTILTQQLKQSVDLEKDVH